VKFSDLSLTPSVMAGVEASGFVDCTPIQEAAIPHILNGKDIAGLAQTGTGKTATFVLPLVDRIVRSRAAAAETSTKTQADSPKSELAVQSSLTNEDSVAESMHLEATHSEALKAGSLPVFQNWRRTNFILVLVPTRELAEQVYENVTKLGGTSGITAVAIYGGTSYEPQKAALKRGVDFVVATPGRLIDLYKEHLVDLTQVRAIVFDEADRMFDMGFKDDMKFVLRRVPQDRQFLVFSATLNFDVLNTAYEFGANPIEVNVSRDQAKAENVVDEIFHVGQYDKPQYLFSVLQKHKPKQVIVFSNFKHNVERIAKFLTINGIPAMGISSLVSQNQRTRIMDLFRIENNDLNILVATDLAARGLDIKGVDMIINFDLPDDAENYVHRIGRTGRAGASGRAYSLVGERDVEALQRIETYLEHKVDIAWIDDVDLIKDLKPFPRDESRDFGGDRSSHAGRPQSGGRASGGHGRGAPSGAGRGSPSGGHSRGSPSHGGQGGRSQSGGGRPQSAGGNRPNSSGGPGTGGGHSGANVHSKGSDRPHQGDRPTQGERPYQAGRPSHPGGNRNPQSHQGGKPPFEKRSHENTKVNDHRHAPQQNSRPNDQQSRNAQAPRASSENVPRAVGSNSAQNPRAAQSQIPRTGSGQHPTRPNFQRKTSDKNNVNRSFKFTPQNKNQQKNKNDRASGTAGVASKVSGFFKKLFGAK
jgi:ATP-dependent RNA helicase RhlB